MYVRETVHALTVNRLSLRGKRAYDTYMKNLNLNLYIFEGVLADYTGGMAVVAALSLERAWEVFAERFNADLVIEKQNCTDVTVIEGVNHAEGVVSYVYGGG